MALGASLTQGVQGGVPTQHGQLHSPPRYLSVQTGAYLPLPLMVDGLFPTIDAEDIGGLDEWRAAVRDADPERGGAEERPPDGAGYHEPGPHAGRGALGAAGRTLDVAAGGQQAGRDSAEIIAAHPVTLALLPPAIGGGDDLPSVRATVGGAADVSDLEPREALRLRARWVQELTAHAALELGRRLEAEGRIDNAERVAWLTLRELRKVAGGAPVPSDVRARSLVPAAPPLPAAFRLTESGKVSPVRHQGAHRPGGRGAGGGSWRGPGRPL